MKRKLACALTATLLAASIAGCGAASGGSTATTAAAQTTAAAAAETKAEAAGETKGAETAAAEAPAPSADTIVIQMGHANPGKDDDPYNKYCTLFGEHLYELSGGKYAIDVIADCQLGGERDMFEGMQMGTIDAALDTTMIIANFVPEYKFLDLPYLFQSFDDVHSILDDEEIMGPINDKVYNEFNVKVIGYGENGFRKILNTKHPINGIDDLKGLKIRTPESSTYLDGYKAMGANPTPMAFTELYTGLQQGTIDGLELPIASINTKKFYEVAPYLSGTDALFTAYAVCISGSFWDNLSTEEQGWFEEAARLATVEEREHLQNVEARFLQEMVDAGLEYNEVEHIDEFINACEQQYGLYTDEIGEDLLDKVLVKLGRK